MIEIHGYTKNCDGLIDSYESSSPSGLGVIDKILSSIDSGSGQIKFIINPEPNIGVAHLEIQAQNGNYVIMLLEYDENENGIVRTYIDRNSNSDQVEILGNFWDSGLICHSFNYIRDIIYEFIENGDIGRERLI